MLEPVVDRWETNDRARCKMLPGCVRSIEVAPAAPTVARSLPGQPLPAASRCSDAPLASSSRRRWPRSAAAGGHPWAPSGGRPCRAPPAPPPPPPPPPPPAPRHADPATHLTRRITGATLRSQAPRDGPTPGNTFEARGVPLIRRDTVRQERANDSEPCYLRQLKGFRWHTECGYGVSPGRSHRPHPAL